MQGVVCPGGAILASHYVVNEVDFEFGLKADGFTGWCAHHVWPRAGL